MNRDVTLSDQESDLIILALKIMLNSTTYVHPAMGEETRSSNDKVALALRRRLKKLKTMPLRDRAAAHSLADAQIGERMIVDGAEFVLQGGDPAHDNKVFLTRADSPGLADTHSYEPYGERYDRKWIHIRNNNGYLGDALFTRADLADLLRSGEYRVQ